MNPFRRSKPEGKAGKTVAFYETPEEIRQALGERLGHYGRLKAAYEAESARLREAASAAEAGIVSAIAEAGIQASALDPSLFDRCKWVFGHVLSVYCFPEKDGEVSAVLLKVPEFNPSHEDVIVMTYEAELRHPVLEGGKVAGFHRLEVGRCFTNASGSLDDALRFVLDQAAMRIAVSKGGEA